MLSGKASLHLCEAPLIVLLVTGSQLKPQGFRKNHFESNTEMVLSRFTFVVELQVVRNPRVRKCVGLWVLSLNVQSACEVVYCYI